MAVGEILAFAYDNFCSNKVRFALTALGMVIGTASLILVVTIGMTGKQYVTTRIRDAVPITIPKAVSAKRTLLLQKFS